MEESEKAKTVAYGRKDQQDPTGNVLQLVDAAVKRLDDLRVAGNDKLEGEAKLRAFYEEKLRDAEAKRIDAIRAVDVNAVAVASERAADQATVLANQVAASAETLRNLVATTATTQAAQLGQITTQLTDRLASLEKAQYEGTGKQQIFDPQMSALIGEVKVMREQASLNAGKSTGMNVIWGYIIGVVGLIGAILGIIFAVTRQ